MKSIPLSKVQKIISGQVLYDDYSRNYYSVDASSYRIKPKMIIIPKNENEIVSVVKFCNKNKIPITARGAGTGLVGGALGRGVILDLQKLKKIKIAKNYVEVGAGVLKGELDRVLGEKHKFLGPNPSVGAFCSLGGMIATNASGSRSLKYGSIIDNLLEVKIIDANGRKIKLPPNKKFGKTIIKIAKKINERRLPEVTKNSCGYRLDAVKELNQSHKIFAGSEGTLGIIVSAKLRILNVPKKRCLIILGYTSMHQATKNCIQIIRTKPSSLEFVDNNTLRNFNYRFPQKTRCLLFVEYDDKIKSSIMSLRRISTGKIFVNTTNEQSMNKWWRYRDLSLSFSLKQLAKNENAPHIIEDAAVAVENLPKLIKIIHAIKRKFPSKIIIYGHAGNGNLHVRLISKNKNKSQIKKIAITYFKEVSSLNGTITGEHGDGLARSEFVKLVYGSKNYSLFKELKSSLDKQNIFNPDVIISKTSTVVKNLNLG